MDKSQKELIKTYYRKRGIAVKQNFSQYNFKNYEYSSYALKNNLIDLSNLKDDEIINILVNEPSMIHTLDKDFNNLDIAKILNGQPKLIDYFKDKLSDLEGGQIGFIISRQPQLIKYFENDLDKLDGDRIEFVLRFQPQLFDYFKDYLGKLGPRSIISLLYTHTEPPFTDLIKDRVGTFDARDISNLLEKHPELKKHFTNG